MSTNLMEKLAISKAIMDKHNNISRGQLPTQSFNISQPELQEFQAPNATYNIPQELMSESKPISSNPQPATKDKILNSRLPDEIKRLMIENPIAQVNPMSPSNSVLSDELIEKASKLMGTNRKQETVSENKRPSTQSNSELKRLLREVVEEVLMENGLLIESDSKTDETMVIKVGKHIFEGKISRIKKTK